LVRDESLAPKTNRTQSDETDLVSGLTTPIRDER